jgi:hypothetical protein
VNVATPLEQTISIEVVFTELRDRARRIVRWPVIACALVALGASSAAFATSPMADDPRLRPYEDAALDHVATGLDRLDRVARDLGLR